LTHKSGKGWNAPKQTETDRISRVCERKPARPERHNSGNFSEALIIPANAHVQAWKACKHWGFCFGHLELPELSN